MSEELVDELLERARVTAYMAPTGRYHAIDDVLERQRREMERDRRAALAAALAAVTALVLLILYAFTPWLSAG